MSGTVTPRDQVEFYTKILLNSGVEGEIKSVSTSNIILSEDGTGEPSHCVGANKEYVKIEFQNSDKSPLHLFVKRRPANGEGREGKLFDKEVFFYGTFLPDALAFTEKMDEFREVPLGTMFAKCYYTDSETIVLENLFKRGLVMTPINLPHTFYQAERVFENLGIFHAVTYAMIQNMGLDAFKIKYELSVDEIVFTSEMNEQEEKYWENTLLMALTILKLKSVDGAEKAAEFLKNYQSKLFQELCEQVKVRDEDLISTLNIGNIWGGNIFVKRDEENQEYPEAVFIDLKSTRLGSPMLDVGSYMFCVADNVHLTNWKYLLDVFYEFISDSSMELGIEDFRFEFDDLKLLYFGKAIHGLFRGLDMVIKKAYMVPQKISDNFDSGGFETWIAENPEANEAISKEIVAKVQQYEKYLATLAQSN